MLKPYEAVHRRVEAVESLIRRGNPERTLGICINRVDPIAARAVGIDRVVSIVFERLCLSIEAVEAPYGTDPERTLLIDLERRDLVIAQTGGLTRIVSKVG